MFQPHGEVYKLGVFFFRVCKWPLSAEAEKACSSDTGKNMQANETGNIGGRTRLAEVNGVFLDGYI